MYNSEEAYIIAERAIYTKHLELCLDGMNESYGEASMFDAIEYRMPREDMYFYLAWLSDYFIGVTALTPAGVVHCIDDFANDNREALRRAAMSGVI